jgi:hypothetical protein
MRRGKRRFVAAPIAAIGVTLILASVRERPGDPQDGERDSNLTPNELKRMRRVTDTMLSAHSQLRDRYRRRALSLTLLIIALSIATASLAFAADDSTVAFIYIHARLSRWVAVVSLVIFFLSMADLIFDWRFRAIEHDQAAARLSQLKQRLRAPQVQADEVIGGEGVESEYERTMSVIPPIPESQFASLKARHAYKVALSQAVDSHPGAPTWWLRLVVRFNGVLGRREVGGSTGETGDLEMFDRGT